MQGDHIPDALHKGSMDLKNGRQDLHRYGMGKDFFGGSICEDFPSMQKDRSGQKTLKGIHLMRGNQNGFSIVDQSLDDSDYGSDAGVVEIGERLIENENRWLHGQHTGDGKSSFFASGEGVGSSVRQVFETDSHQALPSTDFDFVSTQSQIFGAEGDIACNRLSNDLAIGVLKYHADTLSGMPHIVSNQNPFHINFSFLGPEQSDQVTKEGGLS